MFFYIFSVWIIVKIKVFLISWNLFENLLYFQPIVIFLDNYKQEDKKMP